MHYKPLPQPPKYADFNSPEWNRWFNEARELIYKIDHLEATINPASISANSISTQTFSVPSLKVGDFILGVTTASALGVGISNFKVSATDTLSIDFINPTGGAVDPASDTYTILVLKQTR